MRGRQRSVPWVWVTCHRCGRKSERREAEAQLNKSGIFYCSAACSNAGADHRRSRPMVERIVVACTGCGKQIERRASDLARNRHKRFFCSDACLRRVGTRPRTGTEKPCEQCGKPIYTVASAKRPIRFCSKECVHAWNGRNAALRTCTRCGKAYRIRPSQAYIRAALFCSKRCEGDSKLKRTLGRMHNGRPARLNNDGYVMLYEPTRNSASGGWYPEHRLVVERAIGRRLLSREAVHHRNGVKDDNSIDNLEVMDALTHATLSLRDHSKGVAAKLNELEEYKRRFGPLKES